MYINWRERLEREPKFREVKNWPDLDVLNSVPKNLRADFNRNLSIVSRVLSGVPQKLLAKEYGLSTGRVSQLLERCLGGDADQPPLLKHGLIPNLRINNAKRLAPLSTHEKKRGSRCSFLYILASQPELKKKLDKLIESFVKKSRRGQNLTPQRFHQAFIRYLKEIDWPSGTYPFTEASLGYQSARRYLKGQIELTSLVKVPKRAIVTDIGRLRIGQITEIDEHTVHVHGKVVIDFNDELEPLRISRISLIVASDVASTSILAYWISLNSEPSQEDLLSLIEKIRIPWKPVVFRTPGLSYAEGAGFPAAQDDGSRQMPLGIVRLDNALIHKAYSVRELLHQHFGCTINYGLVKTPVARNTVEHAFKLLNINLHRIRSTSGSYVKDIKAEPQIHKKKAPVVPLHALEEMIELLLANANAREQAQLGFSSPLSLWRYQINNLLLPKRPHSPDEIIAPHLVKQVVTVRNPPKGNRRSHINLHKVRYIGVGINIPKLINKRILIVYDRRDIRTLRALTLEGDELGELVAPKTWMRFRHSLRTRQYINKLIRDKRIASDDPLGGYFDYLVKHRHIPSIALKLAQVYREFELDRQLEQANVYDQAITVPSFSDIPEWDLSMIRKDRYE